MKLLQNVNFWCIHSVTIPVSSLCIIAKHLDYIMFTCYTWTVNCFSSLRSCFTECAVCPVIIFNRQLCLWSHKVAVSPVQTQITPTHMGLNVKCALLLLSFNQTRFLTDLYELLPTPPPSPPPKKKNKKLKNQLAGAKLLHTEGQAETHSHFFQLFCEFTWKIELKHHRKFMTSNY